MKGKLAELETLLKQAIEQKLIESETVFRLLGEMAGSGNRKVLKRHFSDPQRVEIMQSVHFDPEIVSGILLYSTTKIIDW